MTRPTFNTPRLWTVMADSGLNLLATATRPAETGLAHHVVRITASFDQVPTIARSLTVVAGTTLWGVFAGDPLDIEFGYPLPVPDSTAVSVNLTAGGIGVTGRVVMVGYTI